MLQRLLSLSAGTDPRDMAANANLPAAFTLDGFGHLAKAGAEAQPLRGSQIADAPSRRACIRPVFTARRGAERALNAARADTVLLPFGALGARVAFYASRAAVALQSPLLLLRHADAARRFRDLAGLARILPAAREFCARHRRRAGRVRCFCMPVRRGPTRPSTSRRRSTPDSPMSSPAFPTSMR